MRGASEGQIRGYPARCRVVSPAVVDTSPRSRCTGPGRILRIVGVALATPRPGTYGRFLQVGEQSRVWHRATVNRPFLKSFAIGTPYPPPWSEGGSPSRASGRAPSRAPQPQGDHIGANRRSGALLVRLSGRSERPWTTRPSATFREELPLPGAEPRSPPSPHSEVLRG